MAENLKKGPSKVSGQKKKEIDDEDKHAKYMMTVFV